MDTHADHVVDSPMADINASRSVSRSRSSSPFTPGSAESFDSVSSRETSFTDLIKYLPSPHTWSGDIERLLIDFYINGICPGRTVATQSNGYVSLLHVANTCPSTRYALLSLSASYISEYLPSQKAFYQHAGLYYSTQALQALATQISHGEDYDSILATSMLLMHHAAVNDASDSSLCWSCHANVFDIIPEGMANLHSDPALFIRAQLTFAHTAETSESLQSTQIHFLENKPWLEGLQSNDAQTICSILGLSPQLLSIISSITSLALDGDNSNILAFAKFQEAQLQSLKQRTNEPRGPEHDILLATAEAFRLAALIYLRCRIFG